MQQYLQGQKIPPCMIGTWAWGKGINGSRMIFGKPRKVQDLRDTFHTAYDLGFHLWDTAEVYGMGSSESFLGSLCEGKKVMISTKYMPGKTYSPGKMRRALQASCNRLGITAPDIYWIHLPHRLRENVLEGTILLKEGKIKSLGISNVSLPEIKEADALLRKEGFSLAAVQNHFSLLSGPKDQYEIIDWCKANGATYFAYMVLEQGALTGRYDAKNHFPTLSLRNFTIGKNKFKKIEQLLAYIKELAVQHQTDPSQIPIAWAMHKGTVPIIGLTKPSHAKMLANIAEITLTEEEIIKLEELAEASGVIVKGSWEE